MFYENSKKFEDFIDAKSFMPYFVPSEGPKTAALRVVDLVRGTRLSAQFQ